MPSIFRPAVLVAALAAGSVPAQETRVDFPDSGLVQPPELVFPFYTLGSGGTIRYQTMCPGTFAGLPTQPMLVTAVGLQIAGRELYDRFEVRCGSASIGTLSNCFASNLADERLQHDLSGQVLPGGVQNGTPVNRWVELELLYPFVWKPGEDLVVDVISSAATPGRWCLGGTAGHPRVYEAPYLQAGCGSLVPDQGLKLRFVFEPIGFPEYGQGCPGTGGFVPRIGATGSSQLGATTVVGLSKAEPSGAAVLMLGFSRTSAAFGPLPFDLGGGCALWSSADWTSSLVQVTGSTPGTGTAAYSVAIPNVPALATLVLYAQWAQIDANSPALVPVTTSNALSIVLR